MFRILLLTFLMSAIAVISYGSDVIELSDTLSEFSFIDGDTDSEHEIIDLSDTLSEFSFIDGDTEVEQQIIAAPEKVIVISKEAIVNTTPQIPDEASTPIPSFFPNRIDNNILYKSPIVDTNLASSVISNLASNLEVIAFTTSYIMNHFVISNNINGINAGEDNRTLHGIWGMKFYSSTKQEAANYTNSYNLSNRGFILGYNCFLDDDMMVGVSYLESTIDVNKASSTRTHIGTIHGGKISDDGVIMANNISYGNFGTRAHGTIFNTFTRFAYSSLLDYMITVTPSIGFDYYHIGLNTLTDHKIKVSRHYNYGIKTIFGFTISKTIETKDFKITPEIRYSFTKKLWGESYFKTLEPIVTSHFIPIFNNHKIGIGITISKDDFISSTLGYDYLWHTKNYTNSIFCKVELKI